jgi:uncharacterized protein
MKKSKLKRRLRKKLRVGEFHEFGFEVSVKFKLTLNAADFEKFVNEFIDEVEENKLLFGGGGDFNTWKGFVTTAKKYQSPTTAEREKIKNWLENHWEIADCEVGNFNDAWYDDK